MCIYIHIYRRETETEKGRHLGAKLTLLRLCRLTSIPLPCTLSTTPRAKHPNGSPRFEQTYSLSLSLPLLYRFSHLPSLSSLHFSSSPLSLSLSTPLVSTRPTAHTPANLQLPRTSSDPPAISKIIPYILERSALSSIERTSSSTTTTTTRRRKRRRLKGDGERRETAGYR